MREVWIEIKERTRWKTVFELKTKGNLNDGDEEQPCGLPWVDLMTMGWLINFTAREGVDHHMTVKKGKWKIFDPDDPERSRYQDITVTATVHKHLTTDDLNGFARLLDKYYSIQGQMRPKENGILFLFGGL